jgi:predicted amidohydrolase
LDVEPEVAFRSGQTQKENMKKLQLTIMAASLAAAMSASASLVTNPGGQVYQNTPPPGTEGFTFTTGANPLVYNELGVYDFGNDGLAASHVVTLFDTAGDILASATVAAGGSSTADSFQWVNIAPVTLSANTTYVLAASYIGNDPDYFYYGPATLPAGVTLGNAVWESGGATVFPDQVFATGAGFFGPNMAVPEPTTMIAGALLLLPFGAGMLRILRKNRVA